MKIGPGDHITLNVSDMKGAIKFFKKLGMQREGSLDNDDIVFLWNVDKEQPLHIQLDQAKGGMKPGLNHIAFTTPDIEKIVEDMKKFGIQGLHEMSYIPKSGRTIFSFEGPDGITLQLTRKDKRGEYEEHS